MIILASGSATRRMLLGNAGLQPVIIKPPVDEAALKREAAGLPPAGLAVLLARAKAEAVSRAHPEALVIGADQVLALGAESFDKPDSIAAARRQLDALRGRSHSLETAVALARAGEVIWHHHAAARLTMRTFSDAAREAYLAAAGDDVTSSVGGYKLEGPAIQLFEAVEGDYFTILGLPLLPLLAELRRIGSLAS